MPLSYISSLIHLLVAFPPPLVAFSYDVENEASTLLFVSARSSIAMLSNVYGHRGSRGPPMISSRLGNYVQGTVMGEAGLV